jgi:hypothetical protein
MKKTVLWLLSLLLVMAGPVMAKDKRSYEVTGTVYADLPRAANEPAGRIAGVPKCTVTLTGTDDKAPPPFTATTGPQGNFDFQKVPPGNYTVTATRPGVGTASRTGPSGSVPASGANGHVYVALSPMNMSLQQQQQTHARNGGNNTFGGSSIPGPPSQRRRYERPRDGPAEEGPGLRVQ